MKFLLASVIALLGLSGGLASAAPVLVDYTVTGSANDWVYHFDVGNAIGSGQQIYFFGIALNGGGTNAANTAIGDVPSGWYNAYWDAPWTQTPSGTSYNQVWYTVNVGIPDGSKLGGFTVVDQSVAQAASVAWMAYAVGGTDNARDGHFGVPANPGFEGSAALVAVPEPQTWLLALIGFGILGSAMRRRTDRFGTNV